MSTTTTTRLTHTQTAALRAIARGGASPSVLGAGWFAHDAHGVLLPISSTTAAVLLHDALVEHKSRKDRRLIATDAGRTWLEEHP